MPYTRPQAQVLSLRLQERRRFIQVVAGPRQVGKTTMVRQVVASSKVPVRFVSADEPSLRGEGWITQQWEAARLEAGDGPGILVVDEVQKAAGWAEAVKRLWDEDTAAGRELRVVLLGSAPWLIEQGLTESLAGRFEVVHLPHWGYAEMADAFGWGPDEYVFFGGYPGAAPLVHDPDRWARYIRESLIETTLARDVLLLTRVDKPALLRRVFELGCRYSGQILSYTKMLGQLHDAGNTTTLAHYLELLARAGMVTGLQKYAGEAVRRRASSPKLQVFNTALVSAQSGHRLAEARADPAWWGRLVESAVGAHLVNGALAGDVAVHYWRDRGEEVDFVVEHRRRVAAIEVKSTPAGARRSGLEAFRRTFGADRLLLVGGDGIPLEEFLRHPVEHWVG
ncbi:MAG: ATP-binding protein [Longimicrobiales bacterium]|nr:ATP-binding protein [Longimicrobiales bacterium]